MKTLSAEQLAEVVRELFLVQGVLDTDSDLSMYVKDSIDLGELIAVVKERYDLAPRDMQLFKLHTALGDVAQIFIHDSAL